ncbi:GGDEF domain-containing phosphodiesterase [Aureimonas sp. ME7]|uniref:putative bifunctional diguanylate cyclase/phosphodiesterase n=1 Tax=Aureimonas sp. ME7 TaxID=2744252 RepID=UPI001FCE9A0A|nr:GGDEF domain-containing phosphodiesterase [Aureimonas sp. ME7]
MVLTLLAAGLHLSQLSVSHLLSATTLERGESFAHYLVETEGALAALVTGLSRNPDIENQIRDVADASGIANFSIFDAMGRPVFSPRSASHAWLLRERPGGIAGLDQLAEAAVSRPGTWQEVAEDESGRATFIRPFDHNGTRLGFIAVTPDVTFLQSRYAHIVRMMMLGLVSVLVLSTGIPLLIYMRRKRRIEQADERIRFLANHDTLTSLLNRKRLEEETNRILATSRATRERLALWAFDVEGMADINNNIGQANGDEVLRTVAARLLKVVDRSDLAARLGADDFVVIQRRAEERDAIEALAKRIVHEVEAPIEIEAHTITPRLCIGVAVVPDHGRTYGDLYRHAELALTVHKSSRHGQFILFEPSMDEEANERRRIERRIREALDGNEFELFYQPIVDARDRGLLGFESLLRLPDGEGGYIPPSMFIPIAEARGYIKAIGTWVLYEAARQIALWPEELFISVNLSAVQFRDGDLVAIVGKALAQAGIAGSRLELEVVESLLLERSDAIIDQLQALKSLGVSIAMDDFGTGYSSLGYLWRFPFDKLKIDQSFMVAFDQGEANVRQIIEAIVSLGHHMKLKVVTEGIETPAQADMLREIGCDQLQGYFFGRPQPAERVAQEALSDWMRTRLDTAQSAPARYGT